jgi:pantoate kinase
MGVLTSVDVRNAARQRVDIRINGKRTLAGTTLRAVENLIGKKNLHVTVESRVPLPIGQGLGMSAAGALSTALALGSVLKAPGTHLWAGRAAHIAEIEEHTGLGDVAAQLRGGWEVRIRPGYPPHGLVDRFLAPPQNVAICVTGRPVRTKSVLKDPGKKEMINRAGRDCMRAILVEPTLGKFFELSFDFASRTGLAGEHALALAGQINSSGLGRASVSMIGNSVFAVGRTREIARMMKAHGKVFVCGTDTCGAGPVI